MSTRAISDYALIGDTRTAALCASSGSIDWMCAPAFDSEPIFGKLVGGDAAGSFSIAVDSGECISRRYVGSSAILETNIGSPNGTGRLTETMAVQVSGSLLPQTVLIRRLSCDRGALRTRIVFDPKLGLPGRAPRTARRADALVCEWGSLAVTLQCFPAVELSIGREVATELPSGSELSMVMTISDRVPAVFLTAGTQDLLLEQTRRWWEDWSEEVNYEGPFRDAVIRSLITLQLLTFSPSGAPVAAPTTSLPEEIGGVRNWDYRFSWPRDASIGVAASLAVGKPELAQSFVAWLLHASRLSRPRVKVLYTLYGKPPPEERDIEGVSGYRGSQPVRMGNGARDQHQLDVYGWVVDAIWLLAKSRRKLHGETWRAVKGMAEAVARHWRQPDAGIWEVRGEPLHYVHSKMMAWLCLDRAIRIAALQGHSSRKVQGWVEQRDRIKREVGESGFDIELGSYVRTYGSKELDAALLILPILEFEEDSERVKATVDAIVRNLATQEGVVFRYPRGYDGLPGNEGGFLPCSFWLVQALARTGRRPDALDLFERLLEKSNDVGLFSEEIDPSSGELLGNFPQAFTHATLIQAALSLSEDAA